jgi:hypothetical protein
MTGPERVDGETSHSFMIAAVARRARALVGAWCGA